MKETAFDVLMYLFENYLHVDGEDDGLITNPGELEVELKQAGFESSHITTAFNWLDGLADQQDEGVLHQSITAIRVFAAEERERLDVSSQGLLLSLQAAGILKPLAREQIIDRLLALDDPTIDIEQTKWVILMVLVNRSDEEEAFAQVEHLVLADESELMH